MAKFQRGWLTLAQRKAGEVWLFKFHTTRPSDGKRVQHHRTIGLKRDFPNESRAWAEVKRLGLDENINEPVGRITFEMLAREYMEKKLGEHSPLAPGTIDRVKSIITNRLIPRWGEELAETIRPLAIEGWLTELKEKQELAWNTCHKIKVTMSLVFKHGERYHDFQRNPVKLVEIRATSDYEPISLTPQQVGAIIDNLPKREKPLAWLVAATGLRISEALGLYWRDIDWVGGRILLRQKWSSKAGLLTTFKTKASKAAVALHPLLATILKQWRNDTPYAGDNDFLFPSWRLKGTQPRTANMIVENYLRPAAVKAGVLAEGDTHRFGFHALRHSLSSFLISAGADPRTVMDSLRHSSIKTTLQVYSQSVDKNRVKAQGKVLRAIQKAG